MKRITPLHIIIWSGLFVIGLVFAILGILVPFLAGLFWVFAILAWLGDAVWITLVVVRAWRKARKGGSTLVGNQAVFQRMRRETDEAISRYLSAVNRKGFLPAVGALRAASGSCCAEQVNQENRHSCAVRD